MGGAGTPHPSSKLTRSSRVSILPHQQRPEPVESKDRLPPESAVALGRVPTPNVPLRRRISSELRFHLGQLLRYAALKDSGLVTASVPDYRNFPMVRVPIYFSVGAPFINDLDVIDCPCYRVLPKTAALL